MRTQDQPPARTSSGRSTKTPVAAPGGLPDHACTPGDIFTNATKDQICVSGYSSSVRDVPQSVKEQVYAAYGITSRQPGQYEVDHLVNLSIGGSNDISNLWPEAASPSLASMRRTRSRSISRIRSAPAR